MSQNHIQIVDVGPRDGLQNEAVEVSTENKLNMIEGLAASGIRRMEIASFVNPKRVPQMADAEAVVAGAERPKGASYIGLVMNRRGAERAIETSVDEIGAVVLSTDTFGQKNQGQNALESVGVANDLVRYAHQQGRIASVTISAAFGCPFEGEVPIDRVVDFAQRIAESEPDEIAIADSIGVANPWHVEEVFNRVAEQVPGMRLRAHFHNTRNTGLANAAAAVNAGVRVLDASIGGLGGCPFAPAATGNIATEDLVYMLSRGGYETGADLHKLIEVSGWAADIIGRELPAMVSRAGGFPN